MGKIKPGWAAAIFAAAVLILWVSLRSTNATEPLPTIEAGPQARTTDDSERLPPEAMNAHPSQ